MGRDAGRLSSADGGGRLRIERKEQKQAVKKRRLEGRYAGGSSGATGGAASSLAFTPSQGIELANPAAAVQGTRVLYKYNL